jgi:tripartite ATP-independent transporter DctM subunit
MNLPLLLFSIAFFALLILGAPVYLSLLVSSLVYFFFHSEISMVLLAQRMVASLDSFVLIAVPMFMLSGNLMNTGGVTDRIFDFAKKVFGHWRGGLAYVNVFASLLFSGMSGSALADVGGLGQIEIKAMKDEKYDDELVLGVTAASGTLGPIIPPSVPIVIYGGVANVSVGALFIGGVIPGFVMAVIMCVYVYLGCRKRNYPVHKRATLRELAKSFIHAFGSLLLPVIIMGSIWGGIATPTEAAMISVIYVLILLLFVYRTVKVKELIKIFVSTVESIVPSLTIVSACALFGWVLQFEHFDKWFITTMFGITTNKYIILFIFNIILFFFGMLLDPTPSIMMLVPIVLPLAKAIGVSDIQMGIIVVLNLMIGLMTPPIGATLFMLSTVTNKPFEYVVKNTYKWLIPLVISLFLVTYIPALTMWLPGLMGLAK